MIFGKKAARSVARWAIPQKLRSYYAANLNSVLPGNITVKSAKPNAFLFAFKNWPLPRSNWANS